MMASGRGISRRCRVIEKISSAVACLRSKVIAAFEGQHTR